MKERPEIMSSLCKKSPRNPHKTSFCHRIQNPPLQGVPVRVRPSAPHTAQGEARKQSLTHWVRVAQSVAQRFNKALILASIATVAACGGGGSSVPPPATATEYLAAAYGDSTQEAQGHPHAASRSGAQVYNRGVGGTNSKQLLEGTDGKNYPWPKQMARETARIVVINHGINDRFYPLSVYRQNLIDLARGARDAGLIPMLEEPNPAGETRTPLMDRINFDVAAFEERRRTIREVASAEGVYFCAQPRVPLEDGIHPTTEGYRIKADRLAACIADLK